LGAFVGDGINYKAGSNAWITLASCIVPTSDAIANNAWINAGLASGWTPVTPGYPDPGFLRRGDGLAMLKGLVKGGTAPGIKIGNLYDQLMPNGEAILYGVSADTFNRIDIYSKSSTNSDDRGAIFGVSGSTSWMSWDSQIWMVGD
jgi:hypothetical protein